MLNLNSQTLLGFSYADAFSRLKNSEDEYKQGQNYYFTAMWQHSQLLTVISVFQEIAQLFQAHPNMGVRIFVKLNPLIGNFCRIASVLPIFYIAVVKQGDCSAVSNALSQTHSFLIELRNKLNQKHPFEAHLNRFLVNSINGFLFIVPNQLPSLSNRQIQVINFFSSHTGDLLQTAMIIGSVTMIALGQTSFGTLSLGVLGYHMIDRAGYVPRKISLLAEKTFPLITGFGLLRGISFFDWIRGALDLISYLPSVNQWMYEKINEWSFHIGYKGIALKDVNAPLVVDRNLSYGRINEILENDHSLYEINPAYCSKWVFNLSDYPADYNFKQLKVWFDEIDWSLSQKQRLVYNKVKDDERFIENLAEICLTTNLQLQEHLSIEATELKIDINKNVELYIKKVAEFKKISPEMFVTQWTREQITLFTQVLNGEIRVKGNQTDLDTAIANMARILPDLALLKTEDPIAFEDTLLKLAIEAGFYCARAMKRAAKELISISLKRQQTRKNIHYIKNQNNQGLIEEYETNLKQSLQDDRQCIVEASYERVAEQLNVSNQLKTDTHVFDLYRFVFNLGFYPFTEDEAVNVNLTDIFLWHLPNWNRLRQTQYDQHQSNLESAFREVGETNFITYFCQIINTHTTLTDEEKRIILEKYSEGPEICESVLAFNEKYHRLILVMLGVLREKQPTII